MATSTQILNASADHDLEQRFTAIAAQRRKRMTYFDEDLAPRFDFGNAYSPTAYPAGWKQINPA